MNKAQALKKLRPILGKAMAWRENPKAFLADEREERRAAMLAARERYEAAKAAANARREEVLLGDAEYQRLKAAARDADQALVESRIGLYTFRIEVGTMSSIAFQVRASGDNWQEVVDALTNAKATQP